MTDEREGRLHEDHVLVQEMIARRSVVISQRAKELRKIRIKMRFRAGKDTSEQYLTSMEGAFSDSMILDAGAASIEMEHGYGTFLSYV